MQPQLSTDPASLPTVAAADGSRLAAIRLALATPATWLRRLQGRAL